jgi:hypothetical protein
MGSLVDSIAGGGMGGDGGAVGAYSSAIGAVVGLIPGVGTVVGGAIGLVGGIVGGLLEDGPKWGPIVGNAYKAGVDPLTAARAFAKAGTAEEAEAVAKANGWTSSGRRQIEASGRGCLRFGLWMVTMHGILGRSPAATIDLLPRCARPGESQGKAVDALMGAPAGWWRPEYDTVYSRLAAGDLSGLDVVDKLQKALGAADVDTAALRLALKPKASSAIVGGPGTYPGSIVAGPPSLPASLSLADAHALAGGPPNPPTVPGGGGWGGWGGGGALVVVLVVAGSALLFLAARGR